MRLRNRNQKEVAVGDLFKDPEALVTLKQMAVNLVRLCEEPKRQVLLVTGSGTPEGRSPAAAVLAFALAQQGRKTALILESEHLKHWNLAENLDYNLVMKPDGDAPKIPAGLPNPYLIGISDSSDAVIYDRGRTIEFLTWARSRFDFVVAYCACFHCHPLPLFLAAHVDGIVLVVDDHTSKRSAIFVKKKIEEADGEILGVVMDRIASPIPPVIMRRWNLV